MAKLGDQIKAKQIQDQAGNPTRTQRVAYKQAVERNRKAKIRFDNLKAQAQEIQETRFVDRVDTVDEQYNIYRPSNYSARQWNNISTKNKANIMKSYNKNLQYQIAKKNVVVHGTATKQVQKTVAFTLEDVEGTKDNSYKDVYDTLSPDLKQFFDTPDVVLQNKATRITDTKQQIADKLKSTDQKIAEVKEKYRLKIAKREASFRSRSSSYRHDPKKKKKHKDRINDYEDDLDEKIAELQGFKKGLSKGSQQLNQNKDVDFKSITNYAWDVGSYEERKERNRNDNRNNYYDSRDKGDLDEAFKKLGLNEKTGYSKYKSSVKDYNKDVAYKNQLVKWSDKVGFGNISKNAQEVLNPSIKDWRSSNPSEKLMFDKIGNVAGIESGKLQQSISIGNYDQALSNIKPIKAPIKNSYDFTAPKQTFDFNNLQSSKYNAPVNDRTFSGGSVAPAPHGSWSYNDQMGLFQAPSEASGQATATFRSPTIKEAKEIKIAQEKGDFYGKVITGLPAQYLQTLGGISNKQMGIEDLKESGALDSGLSILNPVTHYKIFKANYDLKNEIEDISPFMKKYDKEYKEYEAVKVTQAQVDAGGVTEAQLMASNKESGDVNAIITALESEASYKSYKKRGQIITIDELVGKSDASNKMQFAYGGATGVSKMLPYLVPPTRIVMGADLTMKGLDAGFQATGETSKILGVNVSDYTMAGLQTGLGVFVAGSGIKGTMAMFGDGGASAGTVTAVTTKGLAVKKLLTHSTIVGLSVGVGGLDAYGNYKRSGNIYQAVGSGVGTSGALLTGAYFKPMVNKFNDWEGNLGKKQIYTPKFDQKGFARKSGGGRGDVEAVYMKRYEGFKFKDLKTWKPFLKGQHKGSFLQRQYRLVDPKVEARFLGKDQATYWKWQNGKQVKVTESTTNFPQDVPKQHKQWFDQSGAVKQYYLPRSQLKNILKNNYQASGFSATDKAWKGTEYGDDVLTNVRKYGKWNYKGSLPKEIKLEGAYQFTSGKGVSPAFLRVGGKEGVLLKIGGNPAQSPTIYQNYFKGSQVNPALTEVKGMSNILKQDIKFYILSNQAKAGHVQLPVGKHEVEGVLQFTERIPIQSNSFFKFGGRNVAIEQQIFAQGGGSNVDKIVEKIAGIRGGGEAVAGSNAMKGWGALTTPSYSSIESIAYLPSLSQIGSKTGVSINPSNVMSVKSLLKASQVSFGGSSAGGSSVNISGLSKIGSKISLPSGLGSSAPIIDLSLSKISLPSSVFNPSKIDLPSNVGESGVAGFGWLEEKKSRSKRKFKDASFIKGYMPDFTSRALGLNPINISGNKNLMKKINQLQTGFEIRKGVNVGKLMGGNVGKLKNQIKKKNKGFKMPKEIKVKW